MFSNTGISSYSDPNLPPSRCRREPTTTKEWTRGPQVCTTLPGCHNMNHKTTTKSLLFTPVRHFWWSSKVPKFVVSDKERVLHTGGVQSYSTPQRRVVFHEFLDSTISKVENLPVSEVELSTKTPLSLLRVNQYTIRNFDGWSSLYTTRRV